MPRGTIPSRAEKERRRLANARRVERNSFGPGGVQGAGERAMFGQGLLRLVQEFIETNRGAYSAYQGSDLAKRIFGGNQFSPRFNPNLSTSVPGQGGQRFVPNYETPSSTPVTPAPITPGSSLFNPFMWVVTPSLMRLFREGSNPPKT